MKASMISGDRPVNFNQGTVSDDKTSGRIAPLDTVRGAALLMVVCGHFLPGRMVFGETQNVVSTMGRGGVILFFLLSGYLIFRNLQNQETLPFLSRRLFKIFPACWCNVLLILSFDVLMSEYQKHPINVYLANFFLVSDIFGMDSISGVYWTLLIEVKFYLFIAIYFVFLRNRFVVSTTALLIVVNGFLWAYRGQASQLLTFFPVFFVGIQFFLAEKLGWNRRALSSLISVTAMAGLNIWFFDICYNNWSLFYLLAGIGVMMLLVKSDSSNSVLVFLGRISYSHYLYHTSVGYILFGLIGPLEKTTENFVAVMVVFFATTFLAYISYSIIEVPFVNFGKLLEVRWSRVILAAIPKR